MKNNRLIIGVHGSVVLNTVLILDSIRELTPLNYFYFVIGVFMLGVSLISKDK